MVFIEDYFFHQHCKDLLVENELIQLEEYLTVNPGAGKLIRGSGGLRKLRWAVKGRGTRGGARVIYYWWVQDDKILLLDIYSKSEKADLSVAEIRRLTKRIVK